MAQGTASPIETAGGQTVRAPVPPRALRASRSRPSPRSRRLPRCAKLAGSCPTPAARTAFAKSGLAEVRVSQRVSAEITFAISEVLKIRPCADRRMGVVPSPPRGAGRQRQLRQDYLKPMSACAKPSHVGRDHRLLATTRLLSGERSTAPCQSGERAGCSRTRTHTGRGTRYLQGPSAAS
jgi:hypothetical protein